MKIRKTYIVIGCLAIACLMAAGACAATGQIKFNRAERLKRQEKYVEAIKYYTKAIKSKPDEARYRLKLMETLLEASNYYYRLALERKQESDWQGALLELNRSLEYNPANNLSKMEKKGVLKILSAEGETARKEEKTWIEKMKEKTSLAEGILAKADEEEISLRFTNKIDLDKILESLAKTAEINIIFDPDFKNTKMSIVLENIPLSKALDRICMLKNLFYKALDERTIIIIPDTEAKRKIYEDQIIKNFYLSNIKPGECTKLINTILKIKHAVSDDVRGTITVRDTPEKVALVEKLIGLYDKRKAEVLVNVDIMEVNKDRLSEYGTEFSQYQVGQSLATAKDTMGIRGNRFYYLDASDFIFSIPTVVYKLLESDSDSKVIARPQVRGEDGQKITINLGDKVPSPRTSFVPYSTGGLDQQPITSYEMLDVGIEITIVPAIHHDGEVSLDLNFKLSFITSPGTSTLPPTIGNRAVNTKIRLRDGETGIMAGLLRDSERSSQKGIPGLNRLPLLGSLLSSNRKQVNQTDIILRVTPYIVRMPDIEEEDLLPIESGTEANIRLKK